MPFILELPNEYSYVLAAATSTFFVNTLHAVLTSKARKASGIAYPVAYAANDVADKDKKAFLFNCTHANFTENQPSFLGALLISGLRYPTASAILGAGWAVSRVAYALGYSGTGPKGRVAGSVGASLCDLVLKFMAAYTSTMLILGQ